MNDLSVPTLLAANPNVGWLDLPVPPQSRLALFLDDDELEIVSSLRRLGRKPQSMAAREWNVWKFRDPAISVDELLDELVDGKSDLLLLSFGSDVLAYVEMHSGTVLLIYASSAATALEHVAGSALRRESQQATFAELLNRVRGATFMTRARALFEHWRATQRAIGTAGS